MKRRSFSNFGKAVGFVLAAAFLATIAVDRAGAIESTQLESNFQSYPVLNVASATPLVMLNLSRDTTLFSRAYNDYSALIPGSTAIQTTYSDQVEYYGYFDSEKCYTYSSDTLFQPVLSSVIRRRHRRIIIVPATGAAISSTGRPCRASMMCASCSMAACAIPIARQAPYLNAPIFRRMDMPGPVLQRHGYRESHTVHFHFRNQFDTGGHGENIRQTRSRKLLGWVKQLLDADFDQCHRIDHD